jgi:hypothetical protein
MAQIIALLNEAPVVEYLDGERRRKVSPRSKHARVQGLVAMLLERCGAELGMAGTEWDFRVGLVDDSDSFVVPDTAVEVWSPTNDRPFLNRKIAKYLANGSSLVLDVDPRARTIVSHAAGGVTKFELEDRFVHPAVPWLAFDVAEAFKGLEYLE